MKKKWTKRIVIALVCLALAALVAYVFRPQPVQVDIAEVTRGPLQVTVDEDGQTRIRERYVVSAPLAGRLLRIDLDPGDNAETGQLLAVIEPRDPDLLDARAHAESQARVESAKAAVEQAEANFNGAAATLKLAQQDAAKRDELYKSGATTKKERDDAELLEQVRTQEHTASRFAVQVARFQFQLAEAALTHTASGTGQPRPTTRLQIHAPCAGRVLRVFQKSEGFISPGTPLLEFGDPTDLEAVVDVLSTDAVAVKPGDEVVIDHWGGEHPLRGRVRVIEPSAFTKVSSLGVEEQRVNVIIDFVEPPQSRPGLGDGYRIETAIVTWKGDDIVKVPTSALFRSNEQWAVFKIVDGKVAKATVTLGRRNGREAQILEGLAAGEQVVAHPSDEVHEGIAVEQR